MNEWMKKTGEKSRSFFERKIADDRKVDYWSTHDSYRKIFSLSLSLSFRYLITLSYHVSNMLLFFSLFLQHHHHHMMINSTMHQQTLLLVASCEIWWRKYNDDIDAGKGKKPILMLFSHFLYAFGKQQWKG